MLLVKRNILHADFFAVPESGSPDNCFDYVIGNPPWARASGEPKSFEDWCTERGLPLHGRQIAQAFVWKAPRHLRSGGRVCFLLPASVLFNQRSKARDAQALWVGKYCIDKIVNLSDMRRYLFEATTHPALIVRYSSESPQPGSRYEYVVPKTTWEMLRAEVLTVAPEDVSVRHLSELLEELRNRRSSTILKEAFWATPRDLRFLERLRDYPALECRLENKRDKGAATSAEYAEGWVLAEGFNKGGGGKASERKILHELPFLPTKGVSSVVILPSALKEEPPTFSPRRLGDLRIYRAPHILFTHGGQKIGFAKFDCTFEHSVRGLHAGKAESDQLRLVTCALSSSLATYFFFHTSASWAIERPKIHVDDYRSFPVPLSDDLEKARIMREVVEFHRELEMAAEEDSDKLEEIVAMRKNDLDGLINAYYDLDSWEEALVQDTVQVLVPSANPSRSSRNIPVLKPASREERQLYIETLLGAFGKWANDGAGQVSSRVLIGKSSGLGIVSLFLGDAPQDLHGEGTAPWDLDLVLRRIAELLPERSRGSHLMRNIKIFDKKSLHIIKPLSRRYWMRSTALNDADEIAAAILSGGH